MERFTVVIDHRAERAFKGLPRHVQRRFRDAFRALAEDPLASRSGCDIRRLHGRQPAFALRVGSYRALYEVAGSTVSITAIVHRSVAYR